MSDAVSSRFADARSLPAPNGVEKLVTFYRGAVAFTLMTLNGICAVLITGCTLGFGRRVSAEWVSPFFCRLILRLIGIRYEVVNPPASSDPVLYFFNHNSFLDTFLVPALGLPRTRLIIARWTKKILPLYLCNLGIGTFFVPAQKEHEARVAFFKRVAAHLRSSQDSILCSPEGVHAFRHYIAPFNRGVFHLALESRRPIQPVFFEIPVASNPFEGYRFRSGRVRIHYLTRIETQHWTLENLDRHIAETRQIFLNEFEFRFGRAAT